MMMKWGRRRASSSVSKHSFSPISWLSKLKRKGGDSGREPVKGKGKGKGERNSDSQSFSWPESWNDGRFCGGDDDSFWRISFGEERFEGETSSRVGLRSVWYGSDDELEVVPVFGSKNSKLKETPKFNEMVLDFRKMRELNQNLENSPEIVTRKGEKAREGKEFKMLRRKAAKDKKSNRRDLEGKRREMERESDKAEEKLMVGEEKVIFELEPTKKVQTTEGTLLRTIEEDYVFEALNLEKNNWFSKEDMKIKELMSKIENERKSVYINRELQSGKVRVSYPRTVTKIECKIKAIEDMKRGKLKKKKKRKKKKKEREVEEERTAFDNFAMVKCSYNPEQDFRDSMVEMIREKRIRRPEELEELLACYLTLNSDEYHDLIIKVFRHVWFDLDEACFEPEL